jgi:hypothetical protein
MTARPAVLGLCPNTTITTTTRAGRRSARRWHREIARCLAAFAVVAVLAGCAALTAALNTSTALGKAGYHDAGVNVTTGSGLPAGGVVQVSYSRGPTGDDQKDAARAERIVWDDYSARFGAVAIVKVSGGCAGPVCVTHSVQIASATYSQLRSEFGPRPPGLGAVGLSSGLGVPGWVIAVAVILLMAAVTTVIVIFRRYRRPSSWPGSPGSTGSSLPPS